MEFFLLWAIFLLNVLLIRCDTPELSVHQCRVDSWRERSAAWENRNESEAIDRKMNQYYVAESNEDIPSQLRDHLFIDTQVYEDIYVRLFEGATFNVLIPRGNDLQFRTYIKEGRFSLCPASSDDFFEFVVTQTNKCTAKFWHCEGNFKFSINTHENKAGEIKEIGRSLVEEDMSVKLGKSRIEVRDPFDSSSEGNGCDFERSVHEGRDMIRLTVYTQRSCECGAFMIFDHTSNYKLAFSVADRPEPSKIEYYPSFSSAFVPSSMRVPFVGDHTTIIGRTLIVRGRFIADPPQFQIMLLCGGERYEDLKEGHGSVPLVIRINDEDKDTIVIGSQNDKSKPWNEEIRINSKYGSDEFFNIKVRVLWNEMQVIVENVVYQYILHQYHAGPGCIDHISIEGAIVVNEIRLAGGYFPVPYTANFTGGHLAVGEKLHITGLAIGDFEVNLVGENEQDIPFHIKCIFDDVKCVRNSMKDGAWGAEERDGGFPFEKSRYFEMIISIDRPFIEVFAYGWYDGRPHSSFTHRISNPELGYKRLLVKGQVWLAVVEVEKSS